MSHHPNGKGRRLMPLLACLAALTAGTATAAAATPAKVGPPSVMTALGDSITRGFHTQALLTDSPQNSWATGDNASVSSLCLRIRALNPTLKCGAANSPNGGNDAVTGAKAAGTLAQAQSAVARSPKPDLVAILIGANDVCTSTEAAMTSTASFEASMRATIGYLSANLPDARIQLMSIPNIYNLWNVGKGSGSARLSWGLFSICQSMLANPTSTNATDEARRQRVKARNEAFNDILRDVCAEHIHCHFDNYAAYNLQFQLSDLSTLDYFHPNNQGQAKAANVAWTSGFNYADTTAPTTVISRDRPADGVDDWYNDDVAVTLTATDPDSAVGGSEYFYRLAGEQDKPWTRYTGPIKISAEGETKIDARSVDVNGNVEASKSDVIRIDRTPPSFSLSCPAPVPLNGAASATVSGASDDLSGFADDPDGDRALDTSVPGSGQVNQVQIQDRAGNTATQSCAYDVVYLFSGVLQPINPDGSSVFKQGSTVPVKFTLADAAASRVGGAVARLDVVQISDGIEGTATEAVSTAAATAGNAFRYDPSDRQYIFNLSTKGLARGTYSVRVTLDDGTRHSARISLR